MNAGLWWVNKGNRPLGRPRRRGRIILKHILKKTDWLGVDRICLSLETDVTDSCEHGDEPSGSVKLQELLLHKKRPFLLYLVSQSARYLGS